MTAIKSSTSARKAGVGGAAFEQIFLAGFRKSRCIWWGPGTDLDRAARRPEQLCSGLGI